MIEIPDDFVTVVPGSRDGRWWVAVRVARGVYVGLDKVKGSREKAEAGAACVLEKIRQIAAAPTPLMFVTADMALLTRPNDPA